MTQSCNCPDPTVLFISYCNEDLNSGDSGSSRLGIWAPSAGLSFGPKSHPELLSPASETTLTLVLLTSTPRQTQPGWPRKFPSDEKAK